MVLQWFSLVFEWLPLVVYLFSLVFQWFPLVFSTHIYGFIGSIMGFLGSRLVSIGFVRNLARCHCSGPLLPPYHPLLRIIRRSGPRWPPLGLSFLLISSLTRNKETWFSLASSGPVLPLSLLTRDGRNREKGVADPQPQTLTKSKQHHRLLCVCT